MIYSPARILNAKNAILGLKKFEMRLRGLRGSEIPFKCKQCHFRFNWKYNFGTHKPNEQRIYSPIRISNAKNAILDLNKLEMRLRGFSEMRLRGFSGSEIHFKCKQCHVRFNWKYNFGTHKPNEQTIFSPMTGFKLMVTLQSECVPEILKLCRMNKIFF